MADAIASMHARSIIHRDLKPEKILVKKTPDGDTVKLGDFGLSLIVTEPLHTICGTPTYVAPEIIADDPAGYSLPVDMWAMGVISYIIICGFPPFASSTKNQRDLFEKIRAGRFTFPDSHWRHVPMEAKQLIRALLGKSALC